MGISHSPNIITHDLVFCNDPIDKNSYVGSGTSTTNIVNGSTGTLGNGPTHNSTLGYFTYDGPSADSFGGSNQYMAFSSFDHESNQKYTLSAWIKWGASSQFAFMGSAASWSDGFKWWGDSYSNIFFRAGDGTNASNILNGYNTGLSTSQWHNFTMVRNGSDWKFFTNGTYRTTTTVGSIGNTNASATFNLGTSHIWFFPGSISNALVYNNALTDAEVLHNYNVHKIRFGR